MIGISRSANHPGEMHIETSWTAHRTSAPRMSRFHRATRSRSERAKSPKRVAAPTSSSTHGILTGAAGRRNTRAARRTREKCLGLGLDHVHAAEAERAVAPGRAEVVDRRV